MAKTYEPIATTTGTGSSGTVTFSSIPSTYTDLRLVANLQQSSSSYYPYFRVGNGSVDSGNNYGSTTVYGSGTGAGSLRGSNFAAPDFTYASPTSPAFQLVTMDFLNYANTSVNKTVIYRANDAGQGLSATVMTWRSTSAINVISFITTNNWTTNATFTLYGIKAA
jgi:hypothetical protein